MDGVDFATIGAGAGGALGIMIGFLKYALAAPERERRAAAVERIEVMKTFKEELKEDRRSDSENVRAMLLAHDRSCSACRDLMVEVAKATSETATIVRTCLPKECKFRVASAEGIANP